MDGRTVIFLNCRRQSANFGREPLVDSFQYPSSDARGFDIARDRFVDFDVSVLVPFMVGSAALFDPGIRQRLSEPRHVARVAPKDQSDRFGLNELVDGHERAPGSRRCDTPYPLRSPTMSCRSSGCSVEL